MLGVIPWDADIAERERVLKEKRYVVYVCNLYSDGNMFDSRESYAAIRKEWEESTDVYNRDDVVEVRLNKQH